MTILPMRKKCPKCKKMYNFNPDVGAGMICPYCGGLGISTAGKILSKIFSKENRNQTKGQ